MGKISTKWRPIISLLAVGCNGHVGVISRSALWDAIALLLVPLLAALAGEDGNEDPGDVGGHPGTEQVQLLAGEAGYVPSGVRHDQFGQIELLGGSATITVGVVGSALLGWRWRSIVVHDDCLLVN